MGNKLRPKWDRHDPNIYGPLFHPYPPGGSPSQALNSQEGISVKPPNKP